MITKVASKLGLGQKAVPSRIENFQRTVAGIRQPYAESHWSASRIATRVLFMTFLISAAGIEGLPEDTPFEQGFDNFAGNTAALTCAPATLYGYFKKPLRIASLTALAVRFLFGFHIGWFLSLPFSILNEASRVKRSEQSLYNDLPAYVDNLQEILSEEEITPEIIAQELLSLSWRFFGRWGAKKANNLILDTLGSTDIEKFDAVLAILNKSKKGTAIVRRFTGNCCDDSWGVS